MPGRIQGAYVCELREGGEDALDLVGAAAYHARIDEQSVVAQDPRRPDAVSYTHLRAHETLMNL
eukprot:2695284-Prymnesium_polylepis.1